MTNQLAPAEWAHKDGDDRGSARAVRGGGCPGQGAVLDWPVGGAGLWGGPVW
jgi:hypothetical protein